MPDTAARTRRAARQTLQAHLLLGVDFIPIRPGLEPVETVPTPEAVDSSPEPPIESTLAQAEIEPKPMPRSAPTLEAVGAELPPDDKQAALDSLRSEHDAECPHCLSATAHTNTVFGEGNPDAALLFIGEAPGANEDETGRPFVGRAGQKLNEIIKAMKMERSEVYIANVLKSRPPGNRTPLPDEIAACSQYLVRQIRIIRPRVIVTLGGPATKLLLETKEGITRLRGTWAAYTDESIAIPIMPTFHPAYLLRNYTKDTRSKVWSDMQAVAARLQEASAADGSI